jgi:hypothetical protein
MSTKTLQRWRRLRNTDESRPLFRQLWILHYRRSLWAAAPGYGTSLNNMAITALFYPILVLMPLMVGPLFGTYWASFVAGMIRIEYRQDRFDLIGLLPGGRADAFETLAALHIRRSRLFHFLDDALNITLMLGGILLFLLTSGLLVGLASPSMNDPAGMAGILRFIINVATLATLLYVDQIQSTILSLLVGMTVPTHTSSTFEARVWGGAAYVGAQITLYAIALIVGFQIFPLLVPASRWTGTLGAVTAAITLIVIRELAIHLLDRYLGRELGRPLSETAL